MGVPSWGRFRGTQMVYTNASPGEDGTCPTAEFTKAGDGGFAGGEQDARRYSVARDAEQDGKAIRGVIGVIYSDPNGSNRAARLYWHSKETGLVPDAPSEARLSVKDWGSIQLGR